MSRHHRRAQALSLAAIALAAALAGCIEGAAPAGEASHAPAEGSALHLLTEAPTAAPPAAPTLAEAPRLVPGEWWRIQFRSSLFGDPPELVRVVADVQDGGYVVGMPHEAWFKEAVALHAPGFGDVGANLSYEMHDALFEPVRFPLIEGATWDTSFGGTKLKATVETVDGPTATVRFDPPPRKPEATDPVIAAVAPFELDEAVRLVYDARVHEVVKFESMLGSWEVVEHGYGFEGWVTVPRGQDEAIVYGQWLAATPGEPVVTRTAVVEGGFNRMTMLHGIVALGPGAYRIRSVAPDGSEFATQSLAERGFFVGIHEVADPDGTWTLEDVVGGPGLTYTMAIAYHQYDIRLPDGARRADHSHPVIR